MEGASGPLRVRVDGPLRGAVDPCSRILFNVQGMVDPSM